jgi:uncharacterized protein YyaL (SSP411 family)
MVKKWLISSGLVVTDVKDENFGGVYSFYDKKEGRFSFLYPEITGYYLSTLRFLYENEKNERYLDLSKASADWLIRIYGKYGGIVQGISSDTSKIYEMFSFDTGICAKGLIDCFLLTRDQNYLEFAVKLVNWIIHEALDDDGTIKPFKNLQTQEFVESNEVWYKRKGCLHIKVAMPILQLYQLTKQNELLEKAIRICNTHSHFQKPDGSFSLHENSNVVNLHTQCYAIEGLLYAFNITKNEAYLESCKRAIKWSVQKIENDGSIRLWYNSRYQSKASYSIAQLIRLMALIDSLQKNNEYKNEIYKLQTFLLTMQILEDDKETSGGFIEEIYKSFIGWKKKQRLNSWGSMFALQALNWKENYENLYFENAINYLY